jgi:hypothetical protein
MAVAVASMGNELQHSTVDRSADVRAGPIDTVL